MATLLEDFKNTKRELKRIYSVIGDEFGEIDEEASISKYFDIFVLHSFKVVSLSCNTHALEIVEIKQTKL